MPNPKFSIDLLRTRCWYRYLLRETGCKSNSELQERYELLINTKPNIARAYQHMDIRWSSYAAGKNRPVDNTLDAIQVVFGIDPTFFNEGPNGLLLWKALSISNVDKLHEISNYSSHMLDGAIALTRAKIISEQFDFDVLLKLCDVNEENESRLAFSQTYFPDIYQSLMQYFDADSTNDILNSFIEDILPYAFQVKCYVMARDTYNSDKEQCEWEFNKEMDEMAAYESLRAMRLSHALKK
jgi:hypothetical protein